MSFQRLSGEVTHIILQSEGPLVGILGESPEHTDDSQNFRVEIRGKESDMESGRLFGTQANSGGCAS